MQIPKNLPQFTNKQALLIVSGRLGVIFYLAENSKIKKIKSFKFSKPSTQYTDSEGYFEQRSAAPGKGLFVSGAVREPKKQRLRQELYRKLENHLADITEKRNIDLIYLFAPDYLHKEISDIIKDLLPNKLKKKLKFPAKGNYLKSSQLTLLRKIKTKKQVKKKKKVVKPIKKEAQKLYKKAVKATKVIKGKPAKNNPYKKIKK